MLRTIMATAFASLIGLAGMAAKAQELFTREELLAVSPRASAVLVDALVAHQGMLKQAGIATRPRLAHFLSQIFLETGGLRRIDENMNYSADRIPKVFGSHRLGGRQPDELAGNPRLLANTVYGGAWGGKNLGNTRPDDGWNFRGSGYIQLTGRANFAARGAEIDLPLEEKPDLAREPEGGLHAAAAFWKARKINDAADAKDQRFVRILVNGPRALGFEEGVVWFNGIWRRIYRDRPPFPGEAEVVEAAGEVETDDAAALRAVLAGRGLLEAGAREADASPEQVSDALKAFQRSAGIEATGVMDEDTLYAITDPEGWRDEALDDSASTLVTEPDAGSSFRIAAAAPGAGSLASLPPNAPGEDAVRDASRKEALSDEESALLASNAEYSAYEMAGGTFDAQSEFIPHTVIGDDDRDPVLDTRSFPASAIAQIVFRKVAGGGGANSCTGALIAPDVLLTAGHCVHGGTDRGRWHTDFQVFPGRNTDSKYFGACRATELFALRGWTEARDALEARYYDLGAIRLDCAVGERTGWFGVAPAAEPLAERATRVQGYAGDRTPKGRQWISDDRVRVQHPLKLFYQNDTFGGTSGAPVVSDEASTIICVHTNGLHGTEGPWNENNACTRITPERLSAILGWLGGRP